MSAVGITFRKLLILGLLLLSVGCAQKNFDPETCLEDVPKQVAGAEIVTGPRTLQSVYRDMRPTVCNAQVLLNQQKDLNPSLSEGEIWFEVVVEYTGEVNSVKVIKTTIDDAEFVRTVSNFIMDSDFVNWSRHDEDAVFIYPVRLH